MPPTRPDHSDEYGSVEHLDRLLQVTRPRGWLALFALGLLILAALFWGVFGSVPTLVKGRGVLIKTGGVFEVVAMSSGRLDQLTVDVDDIIEQGQVIARIAQPELETEINDSAAAIAELEEEDQALRQFTERELELHRQHAAGSVVQLENVVKYSEQRLQWLRERAADQQQLADRGLITRQRLLDTRGEINGVLEQIESSRNQIKAVTVQSVQFEEDKRRALQQSELNLAQRRRELERQRLEYKERSEVVSPYTGRVLEVGLDEGNRVELGERILRLELTEGVGEKLEAALFVSPGSGKRVAPGMAVHIAPSTVKEEEYGYILGRVTYVASFPSSRQAMMRVLQNEEQVASLSRGRAPIQIYAELIKDPNTFSGFKWSSKGGPPVKVFSGTLCRASITVFEQAPIALLIPGVKKAVLGTAAGP